MTHAATLALYFYNTRLAQIRKQQRTIRRQLLWLQIKRFYLT